MNILLLEPYYGGSHRRFIDGLRQATSHQTTLYSLPDRFWKWRMHGAAVTFARRLATERRKVDLIFVSDMLDLTSFLGFSADQTAGLPAVVYFHENQLTYPPPPGQKRDLHYGFINYSSALAADRVLFNSAFHRTSFLDELPRLLKHFPDYNNLETVDEIAAKSQVLPLGIDLRRHDGGRERGAMARAGDAPVILWNQRWEYDKAPEVFFQALYHLADEDLDFKAIVAGQNFRQQPDEFEIARERLAERIVHYGYANAQRYSELLWQSDIVVSTAIHEFFGIAVVEAMYCNCYPILPRRLSYPELLPPTRHDQHLYDDFDGLLERLRWAITHPHELSQCSRRAQVSRYDWGVMIAAYDQVFDEVYAARSARRAA